MGSYTPSVVHAASRTVDLFVSVRFRLSRRLLNCGTTEETIFTRRDYAVRSPHSITLRTYFM